MLFSTLLRDTTISLRPHKLSLPVSLGECDMTRKIAHHVVTYRKMVVTSVIADKNKFYVSYLNQLLTKIILCQSPVQEESDIT